MKANRSQPQKLSSTGKYRRTVYIEPSTWKKGLQVAERKGTTLNRLVAMLFNELWEDTKTDKLLGGKKLAV